MILIRELHMRRTSPTPPTPPLAKAPSPYSRTRRGGPNSRCRRSVQEIRRTSPTFQMYFNYNCTFHLNNHFQRSNKELFFQALIAVLPPPVVLKAGSDFERVTCGVAPKISRSAQDLPWSSPPPLVAPLEPHSRSY